MYTCLYYWLFAPFRGGITDTPEREPAFSLAMRDIDGKAYELALYCDENSYPQFARCAIADLNTEQIPDGLSPFLHTTQEHLLSVLRLTYRLDLALAEPPIVYAFVPSDQPRAMRVEISERTSDSFDPIKARSMFVHSHEIRELVRLYVDGIDPNIPLQYRFLSLYKLVENRFLIKGRWAQKELTKFLAPYASTFAGLGFTRSPAAALHDMRAKCAHIRSGKGALGVTHLNHKEIVLVHELLPHLRVIAAVIINDRAAGKFALSTEVIDERMRRIAPP